MATTNPYSAPQTAIQAKQEETYIPKVFRLTGRIGRLRFLAYSVLWSLAIWGVLIVLSILTGIFSIVLGDGAALALPIAVGGAFYILTFIAMFALAVRRLNDMNLSGWLSLLIILLPLYPIFWLVLVFAPGTKGNNRYGPQPIENSVEVIIGAIAFPLGSAFVLGILAAVALPAYQDYTIRAQVSEAIIQVSPVRVRIEEYIRENREFPTQNRDINYAWSGGSPYVQSVDVSAGGAITLVLESPNAAIQGKSIVFRPTIEAGSMRWDCTGGDLDARHRPSACRPE